MPGANCSVFGCSTSRKDSGISLFKLPAPKDEAHKKWRGDLLCVITRDRVLDSSLKKQIEKDTVHICEKHFTEDQLYTCKCAFISIKP